MNRPEDTEPTPPRLRLLGPPLLFVATPDAQAAAVPLSPKDAALLARLALDGAQQREHLAAWLWPDKTVAQGHDSLRQRLMRLEQRAGTALFERSGRSVALAPAVRHDLGGSVPSPGAEAAPLLGHDRYDDLPEVADWLARQRRRLREQGHAAWAREAEALEQQQQIAAALPYAQRLAADEPLHEHTQRRLMRLHYLRGDRGAALAVYAQLVERLRVELASTPGAETRELAALIERGPSVAPAGPTAAQLAQLRRPAKLLQRQPQWQQLEQAWAEGRCVLLLGPGGMGKTRLLDDFVEAHPAALRLRAPRGQARLPYALMGALLSALHQARPAEAAALDADTRAELARLDPAFGSAATGPLLPLRLARAIGTLMDTARTADTTHTLAIDDLHHADDASIELLPLLLQPPRQALLAVRPEAIPPALAEWAQDTEALHTVVLTPLDAQGITELMTTLVLPLQPADAWASALQRHTGGNPYLLLETLRALLRDLPQGPPPAALPVTAPMQQLVDQRLQALSAEARALARVSALAGGDFDAALAAHVMTQPPGAVLDAWLELQAAQMCNPRGFVHDLVGEAVLAGLPPAAAFPLHRRIAEYLQAKGGAPARQAVHWMAAGEAASAAHCHADAARAAARASRRGEQQQHWAAAAEAWRQAGDAAAAFEADVEQALCLALAGRSDESRALAERLQQAATTPTQVAQATHAIAHGLTHVADWAAALTRAEQAAALAAVALLPELQAQSLLLAAAAAVQLGQLEHSLQLIDEADALPLHSRLPAPHRLHMADIKAYVLDRSGRYAEAERWAAAAIALARELGEDAERMTFHNNRSALLGRLARLHEARTEAHEAAALGEKLGLLTGYQGLVVRLHRGLFDAWSGDFHTAITDLEAAIAGQRELGLEVGAVIVEHQLAALWMAIGQVARAQRIVSASTEGLPRGLATRRLGLRQRLARPDRGARDRTVHPARPGAQHPRCR